MFNLFNIKDPSLVSDDLDILHRVPLMKSNTIIDLTTKGSFLAELKDIPTASYRWSSNNLILDDEATTEAKRMVDQRCSLSPAQLSETLVEVRFKY